MKDPFSKENYIQEEKNKLKNQLNGISDPKITSALNEEVLLKSLNEQIETNGATLEKLKEAQGTIGSLEGEKAKMVEENKKLQQQIKLANSFIETMQRAPAQPTYIEEKIKVETEREKRDREEADAVSSFIQGMKNKL